MGIENKAAVRALKACAAIACMVLTALMLLTVLAGGEVSGKEHTAAKNVAIMDRYDMYMNNQLSSALEGVLAIEKVYWLSDSDLIAPKPDESKFGRTDDPAELDWLVEDAQELLAGQELLFGTDTKIANRTEINYYLDETILAITWKQGMNNNMYTICEVKIAHPSQLRRFLAGGEYGSEIQLKTSQMAGTVNAVLASAGDFYGYRREGVIVYDGLVRRADTGRVHTCFIDSNGDLHFSYIGELSDVETAQRFVDEKDIRFSVAFGPVLVDQGQVVPIDGNYYLGQPSDPYPRAALCQLGELHYLLVALNKENEFTSTASLYSFADNLQRLGVDKAYALDGGQTATLVMNDRVLNKIAQGSQRNVSDIIYFATALPEGE